MAMCLCFLKVICFLNPVVLWCNMLNLEWSSSSDLLNFLILVVNLIQMKYFACTLTDSFYIVGAAEEDCVIKPWLTEGSPYDSLKFLLLPPLQFVYQTGFGARQHLYFIVGSFIYLIIAPASVRLWFILWLCSALCILAYTFCLWNMLLSVVLLYAKAGDESFVV